MATVMAPRQSTVLVARVARRSLLLMRELPVIPLLVLAVLTFVAIFAPVLAPHSKLDPVKPTKEQCVARYEMANCPYVDNLPPFWLQHGSLNLPLGTDYLGRDMLSRLMYGARISLVVALVGTLAAGVIGTWLGVLAGYLGGWWGPDHHARYRRLVDPALAGLCHPAVQRAWSRTVECCAHLDTGVLEPVCPHRARRGPGPPGAGLCETGGDQRRHQAPDHLAAYHSQCHEHRHGGL